MKRWNLDIIGYWVIEAVCQMFGGQWVMAQKIYSKMYPVSCTNTYHDVRDLVNHGMVKNTKTWISGEWNIISLRNKKVLNLCFGWHISRSYHFVAEVTFKDIVKAFLKDFADFPL